MKRGDLFWAELEPRSGSEQRGRRPVLVISHDGFNKVRSWRSVIVVPLSTSSKQAQRGPTAVEIPKECFNATTKKSSIALCHQITTLDRAKFCQYIGSLPKNVMLQVEEGIKRAIDIE